MVLGKIWKKVLVCLWKPFIPRLGLTEPFLHWILILIFLFCLFLCRAQCAFWETATGSTSFARAMPWSQATQHLVPRCCLPAYFILSIPTFNWETKVWNKCNLGEWNLSPKLNLGLKASQAGCTSDSQQRQTQSFRREITLKCGLQFPHRLRSTKYELLIKKNHQTHQEINHPEWNSAETTKIRLGLQHFGFWRHQRQNINIKLEFV